MPKISAFAKHSDLGKALKCIEDKEMSIAEAADAYNIPYKTLYQWSKKRHGHACYHKICNGNS